MTTVEAILRHPLVQVAGWALIHFVWQGCLIAQLLFCVRALGARQTAQQRYRTACLALLLMAATPPATARAPWRSPRTRP